MKYKIDSSDFNSLKRICEELNNACEKSDIQQCNKVKQSLEYILGRIRPIHYNYASKRHAKKKSYSVIPPILMSSEHILKRISENVALVSLAPQKPYNLYDKRMLNAYKISISSCFDKMEI